MHSTPTMAVPLQRLLCRLNPCRYHPGHYFRTPMIRAADKLSAFQPNGMTILPKTLHRQTLLGWSFCPLLKRVLQPQTCEANLPQTQTDLANLQSTQSALVDSQSLYESLVNALPISLYRVDLAGRITYANQVLLDSLGLPLEDVLGKTSYDFYPLDLATKYRRDDAQVVAEGHPLYLVEENRHPTTGETRFVEVIKIPIRAGEGQIVGIQGLFWDVTESKQTAIALSETETLWRSLAQNSADYIMLLNQRQEVIFLNRVLPGFTPEEILGVPLPSLEPHNRDQVAQLIGRVLTTGIPERYDTYRDDPQTGRQFFERRILPLRDSLRDEVLLVTSTDVTTQRHQEQRLERLAHYDALTNLPNRLLLETYLQQAMQTAQQQRKQIAVVYLDLDGFKAINDTYGRAMGDQLLTLVANQMHCSLRQSDFLARLGGDEFAAILTDLNDLESSVPVLSRLLDTASQPMQVGEVRVQMSASLGVTFFPQAESIDADQLLRQADLAMYQAKLAGKNCYHIFDTDHDRNQRVYHETLKDLRRALANQELVLHYQPQINARTREILGAEALLRWHHPERQLLYPADFLAAIANQPLVIELGEWVIETALTQLEDWHRLGFFISVSVNVDAYHLQQANFIERLQTLLAAHPTLAARYLKLEILETSALDDMAQVSQVMRACQALGVSFALDDFGTGYSSLTHLKHLPASQLKIDKSFVRDMLSDPSDLAILKGVLGLAQAFHREVIAEGVETLEHLNQLLGLGCELAQGYGIARPMTTHDFAAWAKAWNPPAEDSADTNSPRLYS